MHRLTLFHSSDMYEILYDGNRILHIDKLVGESQLRREITFDKLPEAVQSDVLRVLTLNDEEE